MNSELIIYFDYSLINELLKDKKINEYQLDVKNIDNIRKIINTTPDGEINPFYNSFTDTYGTINLPEIIVSAPYTRKASLAQQARRGRESYYKAGKKIAPILASIPIGAGLAAMGTTGLLGLNVNPIDVASVVIDPSDPINYLPLSRYGAKVANQLRPKNIRKHVYMSKSPIGYNFGETPKKVIKGILSGKTPDINKAPWEKYNSEWDLLSDTYGVPIEKTMQARTDAWRMYMGFPQKYNTFSPSKSYLGAYTDVEGISALDELPNNILNGKSQYDFINTTGGGIGIPKIDYLGQKGSDVYGLITTKDVWDLHPFSRGDDRIINRIVSQMFHKTIGNKMRRFSSGLSKIAHRFMYDQKEIDNFFKNADEFDLEIFDPSMFPSSSILSRKIGEKLEGISNYITDNSFPNFNRLKPLEDKIAKTEIGSLIGAKPFTVIHEIPFTKSIDVDALTLGESITSVPYIIKKGFKDSDLLPTEAYRFKKMFPYLDYKYKK